jgi:fructose-bisphosphate aldolase class I
MNLDALRSTARALVAPGKGILAADESTGTIEKRFKSIHVTSTEENRRAYRELLFATPGMEEFISGVIFFDETLRQQTRDGRPFPELLASRGVIPGIKVDNGAKAMAQFPGEKIAEGLDGLRERFADYRQLGAKFSKGRAVITIGNGIPTQTCIKANAEALARYAVLAQEAQLVPIVEPEVLMDGDHTLARCAEATEIGLRAVFNALAAHRVALEGMLLKPNMVVAGEDCAEQPGVEEVAKATFDCLRRVVPAAVPGVVFLSGGQTDEVATAHLNAMNRLGDAPWQLSFSFGRALQSGALKTWSGEPGNVPAAQRAFRHRASLVGAARRGQYSPQMELREAA